MKKNSFITILLLLVVAGSAFAGQLDSLQVTPDPNTAGDYAVYQFVFKTDPTTANFIPSQGKIVFVFPANFDVSRVYAASSADTNALNGGFLQPTISNDPVTFEHTVICQRDGTGDPVNQGTKVTINLSLIGNPANPSQQDSIHVKTYENVDITTNAPLDTGTVFVNISGPITSFTLVTPSNVTAGTPFDLTVTNAVDVHGDPADGVITIETTTGGNNAPDGTQPVLNDIVVTAGTGSAQQTLYRAESVQFRGTSQTGATASTGVFDVAPAGGDSLSIAGEPTSTQAGSAFANDITVTVYDQYGNIATGYAGSVYFTSTDNNANFTFNAANKYTFVPATDQGAHAFSGSDFALTTAGNQKIYVTDDTITDSTGTIAVTPATVNSFDLTIAAPATAGSPSTVTVANARDAYGNAVDCTVSLAFSDGAAHTAPNGTQPVLPDVHVTSGSGSVDVTMYKAEKGVALRGTSGAATQTTANFDVNPAALYTFEMTGYPSNVIAGNDFGSNDVTVTALDAYGNTKTDYTGKVWFTSTDGAATLTYYDASNAYTFQSSELGTHTFAGSNFVLNTSGQQKITVTDGTIARASDNIAVQTGNITDFAVNVSTTTPQAGQAFDVLITNAVDASGNPASGLIAISFNDGASHTAPDGHTEPVLSHVEVSNGSGQASQVLYRAEANVILKAASGAVEKLAPAVNVQPGQISTLNMTGYPDSTVAGVDFGSNDITVTVMDAWGNIKTDFTGSVYFSSTDPLAVLPYDNQNVYQFDGTENGVKVFAGSGFELRKAGTQTISVHSGSVSEASSNILVQPGTISDFTLTAATTQTAGVQFDLQVTGAKDQYNNAADGIIEVVASTGGNNAPNGQPPILNNIQVTNGVGSAAQTLVKVEDVVLRGTVQGTAIAKNTGTITVNPGDLALLTIAGYPNTVKGGSAFPSNVVVSAYDGFGNAKSDYTGTITFTSTDGNATLPLDYTFNNSYQHAFSGSNFVLKTPGAQTITVSDNVAGVSATTDAIEVNSISIESIVVDNTTVSQGQNNIAVRMVVKNSGNVVYSNVQAQLLFRDSQGNSVDAEYTVIRTDAITTIAGNQTTTLQFNVDVADNATLDTIDIDGYVSGLYNGLFVDASGAATTDQWQVQVPANITTLLVSVDADTIDQGQSGIYGEALIENRLHATDPVAAANIISSTLVFYQNGAEIPSSYFSVSPDPGNQTLVAGADTVRLKYHITAAENAPTGTIDVYSRVIFSDANTGLTRLTQSPLFDTFYSQEASIIELTSVVPSQNTVTSGQDSLWQILVGVKNAGTSTMTLDFNPDNTNIRFKQGNTDYTDLFLIDPPIVFEEGGTTLAAGQEKHLKFVIRQTASATGLYTVHARVQATNGFYDTSLLRDLFASIEVQAPEDIRISSILPSQTTATINDTTRKWTIAVPVENRGGSEVAVLFDSTHLVLSDTTGFIIKKPDSLLHSGTTLKGGEKDTLLYTVLRTGSQVGVDTIGVQLYFRVLNTNQKKTITAASSARATVTLQYPSEFHITGIRASRHYVTAGVPPNWWITVQVSNETGGSDVEINLDSKQNTWVRFYKNGLPQEDYVIDLPNALAASGTRILAAGKKDSLIFPVSQMGAEIGELLIISRVQARELNREYTVTRLSLNEGVSDTVVVQTQADIAYVPGTLFPQTVSPQSSIEFQVNVGNSGQSTVELDPLQTLFQFSDGIRTFSAMLDDSYGSTVAGNSVVTLHFKTEILSKSFSLGAYSPQLILVGTENGNAYQKQFLLPDPVSVTEPSELAINFVTPSVSSVTAGQTIPWLINIQLSSNGPSSLHLDSSRVTFFSGSSDVTQFFEFQMPDTLIKGNIYLRNNSIDTLQVKINSVDANAPNGPISIYAQVWMTDSLQAGRQLVAQTNQGNSGTVLVQAPAQLDISAIDVSQKTVTRGQDVPWSVIVHVRNNGGSDLRLNPDSSKTVLNFSKGNSYFQVKPPSAFHGSGSDLLSPGVTDSLYFTIQSVDSAKSLLGPVVISAAVSMLEINTGREFGVSTDTLGLNVVVTIQDSARLRLDSLLAAVPYDTLVNAGQNYYLQARITNTGDGDEVHSVKLQFYSEQGLSAFPQGDTITVFSIAAGESKLSEPGIPVRAPNALVRETFHVRVIDSKARNTRQPVRIDPPASEQDTTLTMTVQSPGQLVISKVYTSIDTIPSGTVNPWYIYVVVNNPGQGRLLLQEPQAENIVANRPGYVIVPDTVLSEDGLMLTGGDADTLVYKVVTTSPASGTVTITAKVSATDGNDPTRSYQQTGQVNIFVTTTAAVLIAQTVVDADSFNVDETGVVHVNTRQPFAVNVSVRNAGGQDIDSVRVLLSAPTSRVLQPQEILIRDLKTGRTRQVAFSVIADSVENLNGEILSAKIVHAYGIDGSKADIIKATDSTVVAKIYNPAVLQLVQTLNKAPNPDNFVSFGQTFPVTIAIRNSGSETVRDIQLRLTATPDSLVTIPQPVKSFTELIRGGEIDTFSFDIQAKSWPGKVGLKAELLQAVGVNAGTMPAVLTQGADDTTFAIIEQGAILKVDSVFTSVEEINAGDTRKDWRVNIAVSNPGQADLMFVDISAQNIRFTIDGEVDDGYLVRPPSGLKRSKNFILPGGGQPDTLIYVISENGKIAGHARIDVDLSAYDINKGPESEKLHQSGYDSILVISTARVKIVQTTINTDSRDETGAYLINKDQMFEVRVVVETGERTGADSVVVQLTSDGNTISEPLTLLIDSIPADSIYTAVFPLIADNSWNTPDGNKNEVFQAKILSAKAAASALPAQIIPAKTGDDVVKVRLQEPAQISLSLLLENDADSILTAGQVFNVIARVQNLGTAPTDTGAVTLYPPSGYFLIVDEEETIEPLELPFRLLLDQKSVDVPFTLKSPSATSLSDTIRAMISRVPLDRNSGQTAKIAQERADLLVTTLSSQLQIVNFSISAPDGARDGVISTLQDFYISSRILSSANLKNLTAQLTVPEGFILLSKNEEIPLTEDLRNGNYYEPAWKLRAPEAAIPYRQEVTLRVTGTAVDGQKADVDTIGIDRVVARAELELEDLTVSSPEGVMQDGVAVFSIGQKATLRTRIFNKGEANVLGGGKVRLDLFTSDIILDEGEVSEKSFKLVNQAAVVEWRVIAPSKVKDAEQIRVSLTDYPKDENTNLPARVINSPNELTVKTIEKGFVQVERIFVKEPVGARDDTISTAQKFVFSAEITSQRVKEGITARIHFKNDLLGAAVPTQQLLIGTSQLVNWEVQAPDVITSEIAVDSIWIEISARDRQSGIPITARSATYAIFIQPRTEFWIDPKISFPPGLTDRVSTEQDFNLTAFVRHQGAPFVQSDSFTVEITRPTDADYVLFDDVRQKVASNPTWRLRAPSEEPPNLSVFRFLLIDWPRDKNSGEKALVRATSAELSLLTVKKALLSLRGYLNPEAKVTEGSVRVGSSFEVTAMFDNQGTAKFDGSYSVAIQLPPGYVSSDPDTQTTAEQSVTWTVQAPVKVSTGQDTIRLHLVQPPLDQYARKSATIIDSTSVIFVRTEAGMVVVKPYSLSSGTALVKGGTNIPVFGLEIRNRDNSKGSRSVVKGLKLLLKNKQGALVSPQSVLSRIAAVLHGNPQELFAETTSFGSGKEIYLDFTALRPDTIYDTRADSIDILVDISPKAKSIDFSVAIDSASSVMVYDAVTNFPLIILDSTLTRVQELNFSSSLAVVFEQDLKSTFCNYPNPFGSSAKPETKFLYYLKQASDVDIKIFTLTGDLVKSWSFTKSSHPVQTSAGIHEGEVIWDGRNEQGARVLNGVYLAYINTEYGERALTKVMVVK